MYSKIIHLHSLNGEVAQSVEQKTENLCVGGSIPSLTTQGKKPFRFLKGFFIFVCPIYLVKQPEALR